MQAILRYFNLERMLSAMQIVLPGLVLVMSLFVVTQLTKDVFDQLGDMQNAELENIQWSLSQSEVDFLEYHAALSRPIDQRSAESIRRRFNNYNSRINTFSEERAYEAIRQDHNAFAALRNIQGSIAKAVPIIDLDNQGLLENIDRLLLNSNEIRANLRSFSTYGTSIIAAETEQARSNIATIFLRLVVISVMCFIAIAAITWMFYQMYRLREIRTRELEAVQRDLVEARDRALAGERAKARFLAVMSHEMRTPLNGILGAVDLIRSARDPAQSNRYLDIVENSGRVLLEHVNDVLDITYLEAGDRLEAPECFVLRDLIEDLMIALSPLARDNQNQLTWSSSETLTAYKGYPSRLRQVLINLIANALKFTKGGEVNLDISVLDSDDRKMVEFQVSDTGVGIPEEMLDHIFDDFTRVATTDTGLIEGTGLGLGIVKRLTSMMGGDVGVESEEGEGSLFWVRLPLYEVEPDKVLLTKDQVVHDVAVAPIKVLIVEDTEASRVVMSEMLNADGHEVDLAENGQAAVDAAKTTKYDLILMDISMPVMGGVQATRVIRADGASRNSRIVALTAYSNSEHIDGFEDTGFDDLFTKPLSWRELRRITAIDNDSLPDHKRVQTDQPILERQVLNMLREYLPYERYETTLLGYVQETKQLMEHCPFASKDIEMIHRIAGLSATVGARKMHGILAKMEQALKSNQSIQAHTVALLEATWKNTKTQIQQEIYVQDRLRDLESISE